MNSKIIMNKILLLLLSVLILSSCETEQDVKDSIVRLKSERSSISSEVMTMRSEVNHLSDSLTKINEELKIKGMISSGQKPKYVLKLKLSQSRMTLDIDEMMKDAMNEAEFTIPVDEEMYKSVQPGTRLVNNFRVGSFIMNGSFSSWDITVINKEIQ